MEIGLIQINGFIMRLFRPRSADKEFVYKKLTGTEIGHYSWANHWADHQVCWIKIHLAEKCLSIYQQILVQREQEYY